MAEWSFTDLIICDIDLERTDYNLNHQVARYRHHHLQMETFVSPVYCPHMTFMYQSFSTKYDSAGNPSCMPLRRRDGQTIQLKGAITDYREKIPMEEEGKAGEG